MEAGALAELPIPRLQRRRGHRVLDDALLGWETLADLGPGGGQHEQQALVGAVVGTSTQGVDEADDEEARPLGHEYESKLGFVVLDDAGNSLLQSASAPVGALERLLAELPRTAEMAGASGVVGGLA